MAEKTNETPVQKAANAVFAALDKAGFDGDLLRVTIETIDPLEVAAAKAATEVREVPILKTTEERYVLGVVLEPTKELGKADSQGDLYTSEEVRQAAHKYMENYGTLGLQHQFKVNGQVKLLENWIARSDETIDGQVVKAGTWLMGIRVVDDDLWDRVKKGKLTGFSIGGFARRTPVESPKA